MSRCLTFGMCALAAGLAAAAGAAAHPVDVVLEPVTATYALTRGRVRLGEMTTELTGPVDGVWRYRSESRATGFVAMFTDISIDEQSEFRVDDGHTVPLRHDYVMAGSKKDRDFSLVFDWRDLAPRGVVRGTVRGDDVAEPVPPGAVDRHTTPLALALAVAAGREFPFEFVMVDRARVRHYEATDDGEEKLDTRAGRFDTARILLTRLDDPERKFWFWLAPERGYLPVRIRSVDDSGRLITVQLIDIAD